MFAIVGLADATNHLLQCEGLNETFGRAFVAMKLPLRLWIN